MLGAPATGFIVIFRRNQYELCTLFSPNASWTCTSHTSDSVATRRALKRRRQATRSAAVRIRVRGEASLAVASDATGSAVVVWLAPPLLLLLCSNAWGQSRGYGCESLLHAAEPAAGHKAAGAPHADRQPMPIPNMWQCRLTASHIVLCCCGTCLPPIVAGACTCRLTQRVSAGSRCMLKLESERCISRY